MLSRSRSSVFPSVLSHVCPHGNCVNGNLYHIQECGGHSIKFVHVISALWSYVLSRQHASLSKGKTPRMASWEPPILHCILYAFSMWIGLCTTVFSIFLQDLLGQDGFPTHHVSLVEKQQFKSVVLRWIPFPCMVMQHITLITAYTSLSSGNRPTNVC